MSRAAAIVAALAIVAGCATPSHELAFDRDDVDARELQREHMAQWCRMVGPCESGRGGLQPAPGAPPLPAYTEACGYLPPVYGDDC